MRSEPNDDERYTTKELLTMALNAVIAEILCVDVGRVQPHSRLVTDLGMYPVSRKWLQREICFLFDVAQLEIPNAMRVGELVDLVANTELSRTQAVDARGPTDKTGSGPGLTIVTS